MKKKKTDNPIRIRWEEKKQDFVWKKEKINDK